MAQRMFVAIVFYSLMLPIEGFLSFLKNRTDSTTPYPLATLLLRSVFHVFAIDFDNNIGGKDRFEP